jgi:Flp pilus assembly protein TadG
VSEGELVLAVSSRPSSSRAPDHGAVAVEFALVLPLLMMFLFGIIQYGYGLFQLQAITATVGEATQQATTGVTDCGTFSTALQNLTAANGLDRDSLTQVDVQWLTADGTATSAPDPLGLVKVTATFVPFKIGIPFVPFPDTITRSQTGAMQNIVSLNLPGCDVAL